MDKHYYRITSIEVLDDMSYTPTTNDGYFKIEDCLDNGNVVEFDINSLVVFRLYDDGLRMPIAELEEF